MSIEVFLDETRERAIVVRRSIRRSKRIKVQYIPTYWYRPNGKCADDKCLLCYPAKVEQEAAED